MPVSGFYAELFVAFALTGSLTGLVLGKWYTLAQGVKCKIPIDSTELTPLNEAIRFFQNGTHGVQDRARPQNSLVFAISVSIVCTASWVNGK